MVNLQRIRYIYRFSNGVIIICVSKVLATVLPQILNEGLILASHLQ